MFTKIATVALAVAFLSAGAFANSRDSSGTSSKKSINMTVVSKNQTWPVKGHATVDPCKLTVCVDI
jgi:hypothetical protein